MSGLSESRVLVSRQWISRRPEVGSGMCGEGEHGQVTYF